MRKIVFINQWPSHLTKDIVNAFAKEYDEVAVIAGRISESGSSLDKKVIISRIVKYNKKSTLSRVITWIIATVQTILLVNLKFRNYHLFLTSNPPTLAYLPLFCRNKYSVQVLDIYPDALVAGEFIKERSCLYKIWVKQNMRYFAGASNVFTITNGMAKTISQYCTPDKIRVIAQWPASSGYAKIERDQNKFIQRHTLEKYFIVMYSGNIGLGHHVASLVEAARLLKDYKDILFVIIGEGFNKPVIEKLIRDYKLRNCLVLPFQSYEMFKYSSQAADIGVVSVSKELAMLSVPIKIYNLINNNIPLLGITEGESELASLISKYEIGQFYGPSHIQEIADYIVSLKNSNELINRFKVNLRICAEVFTPKNASLYSSDFLY
ncbi:MAG: glycosyltransferase family 4 protein [Bacteroidales bacterium]|nr:glycosyltransferase family 4 protein [Bacteroidales bacterium]